MHIKWCALKFQQQLHLERRTGELAWAAMANKITENRQQDRDDYRNFLRSKPYKNITTMTTNKKPELQYYTCDTLKAAPECITYSMNYMPKSSLKSCFLLAQLASFHPVDLQLFVWKIVEWAVCFHSNLKCFLQPCLPYYLQLYLKYPIQWVSPGTSQCLLKSKNPTKVRVKG